MRTRFTDELVALTADPTQMCRLTQKAAERVTDALVTADSTAAYEAFALEEELQRMHNSREARTVVPLAPQAPVARDLRRVVTAIQIAGEPALIGHHLERSIEHILQIERPTRFLDTGIPPTTRTDTATAE
ncbi:PhoU domain-containing protein [Nocardia brevicatena]|uniref:PhoU domain-containing protein n=1 Tax=Nocardia brevicatena TaxID=37327 RepID=UPI0002E445EA|nr:PhoU domain-containing protein [Nocardia brevicatena]